MNSRSSARRTLIGAVCGVALLIASIPASRAGEPESHGHPLSYWLEHYSTRATDEDRKVATEAEAAIRDIGTNAIPALLVWLRYEPSQTKMEVLNFLARVRRSAWGRWVPAEFTYDHGVPPASVGFLVLGPTAAEAIPELERIANDAARPRPAIRAMMALTTIGPLALRAVESRLANTNFTVPPRASVGMYLRTRTLLNAARIEPDVARVILKELQTNSNPVLVDGANQVLEEMDSPSLWEPRRKKSLSEALSSPCVVGGPAPLMAPRRAPGVIPAPPAPIQTNSIHKPGPGEKPSADLHSDEPYPYPLRPGTAAWNEASALERVRSVQIPKEWKDKATSWQLFRSAIANPYFRVFHLGGEDMARSYEAARQDPTLSILSDIDTSPDFGTNVVRWLGELDLARMEVTSCVAPDGPCYLDFLGVWFLAGRDSALETMDVTTRQRLLKLAVWDADRFVSKDESTIAAGPVAALYGILKRPESFRGPLPRGVAFPPMSAAQLSPAGSAAQTPAQEAAALRSALASAKAAFGLTQRP